jgi:hypothetical protein
LAVWRWVERAGRAMVGINSQEGQPSRCGAVVRRWLAGNTTTGRNAGNTGENTGKNSGDNARNASSNAKARCWALQAAPVVTPCSAARSGASAASPLPCLCARLASVDAARSAGLLHVPEQRLPDPGALHGSSSHASMVPPSLARFTALRLSGVRACSSVKRGDCRDLSGSVWIRLNSPDLAQCPSAPGLGTLGGMIHATPATRQRTRRAPTLPTWKWRAYLSTAVHRCLPRSCQTGPTTPKHAYCPPAPGLGTVGAMVHAIQNAPRRTRRAPALPKWAARARTCPAVAKPAQECPTRPVALTVRGGPRDNAIRAVRHDGGPRSWGRAVVNGTRSASSLRAPGVRAARLQALAGSGLSRHGASRSGDRRAASHRQQSGEFQP